MSTVIRCIIIDDEPPAIRLLEKFIAKVSFLELKESFTNPLKALHYVEDTPIDLIFLDIQMPEITGIQLSKIMNPKTKIIFTTAYAQFALESYEVATLDYLLKPIDFERFYKACLKAKDSLLVSEKNKIPLPTDNFFFFKTDGKNNFSKVFLDAILYVEGLKNYVSIHLKDERIITYSTLKHFKENLPKNNFIQIHKSYIVSIKDIDKLDNENVWINDNELPVGNTFRKMFFEAIKNKQL